MPKMICVHFYHSFYLNISLSFSKVSLLTDKLKFTFPFLLFLPEPAIACLGSWSHPLILNITILSPIVFDFQSVLIAILRVFDLFNTMPIQEIADKRPDEAPPIRDTLKAGLAEFISTLIFVFAGEGSGMTYSKLTNEAPNTPIGLIASAIAHAFSLFVAVSVASNFSRGHVNPAVTFGAFIGGNITYLQGIIYWIAQLLGSIVACLLLWFVTGGMRTPAFGLSSGVEVTNAVVLEIVMTFGLVYTVFAIAVDPKKGKLGTIAPIAIGLIVGANILVGGGLDGASMNPAASFGPALVSWSWENHWVYWVGPLIGGGLAGLLYELVFVNYLHELPPPPRSRDWPDPAQCWTNPSPTH